MGQVLYERWYLHGYPWLQTSYTWHSILGVWDIMLIRSRWLVGDGQSVEAWNSCWLPRSSTFKVIMPRPSHLPNVQVCDLIDYENAYWYESLVREFFLPIEAEMILAVPLCASWPHDKLIWHYCPNRSFSVRSAYHMIMKARLLSDEGSLCPRQTVWKMIWSLCLPPRIKLFAWRIYKGILLTNSNLARCMPSWNMNCSICGHHEESDMHALLECPLAVQVWEGSQWNVVFGTLSFAIWKTA